MFCISNILITETVSMYVCMYVLLTEAFLCFPSDQKSSKRGWGIIRPQPL